MHAVQIKKMFEARRIWATLMYFVTMILTLVFALVVQVRRARVHVSVRVCARGRGLASTWVF